MSEQLPASRREPQRHLTSLVDDLRLLLYVFVAFRLILVMVYQPQIVEVSEFSGESYTPLTVERGLSQLGDLHYYYSFAEVIGRGDLPYRDFWHEFPPAWITLFAGVYGVMDAQGPVEYGAWATVLGLLMVVVDAGNLLLLHKLAHRLYGARIASGLSWVYALLAVSVIFPWWTFESLVLFWILLALVGLLEGRMVRAGGGVALGVLTKYLSVLMLPAVWRFYAWQRALRVTLVAGVVVVVVLGGLLAWGREMAWASLTAQANKASYQTVWALIDGNWRTGSLPGVATRYDADSAFQQTGNASVVPDWLRLIPFLAFGLYLFSRPMRQDDHGVMAFFTLTLVLFFLWSHGWSPQWALTLSPLILLNFPTRDGVLVVLVLGMVSFIEYPVLFARSGETGEIAGGLVLPFMFTILLRTALLVGVVVALMRRLQPVPVQEGGRAA